MQLILEEITKWSGPTSQEDGYDFCDQVCRAYGDADADTREELREAVACNERVSGWLLYDTISEVGPGGFLVEATKRATETGDYQSYPRSALLTISITNGFGDSRNTLMWLAELWREAEAHGVDPSSAYEEIGRISRAEPIHMIGGPTAGMILQMLDERRRDQLRWS